MITPIERLGALSPKQAVNDTQGPAGGMFESVFKNAVENVRAADAEKTETEYLLATGQLDNPAALTIATAKNQIAVELLVQLRNKAVEAYTELTRINM